MSHRLSGTALIALRTMQQCDVSTPNSNRQYQDSFTVLRYYIFKQIQMESDQHCQRCLCQKGTLCLMPVQTPTILSVSMAMAGSSLQEALIHEAQGK
jgi:hypothetical protein